MTEVLIKEGTLDRETQEEGHVTSEAEFGVTSTLPIRYLSRYQRLREEHRTDMLPQSPQVETETVNTLISDSCPLKLRE